MTDRAYFDTSAVVAYYVPESLSTEVQRLYRAVTERAISDLVEVEVLSALSLRVRIGDLQRTDAERIARMLERHLEGGLYTRRHLHTAHYRLARDFIARFDLPLKAPDALHLALCAAEGLSIITADEQLARNAQALGLEARLIGG